MEQGILVALFASILDVVRRQYKPRDFLVGVTRSGQSTYQSAAPGHQSASGSIVFRYDAELFYANVNRFVDDVEALVDNAPDPVRCLILDASTLDAIDCSAGLSLSGLLEFLQAKRITFLLARADPELLDALQVLGLRQRIPDAHIHANLVDAVRAFQDQGHADGDRR